ncbi:hypothetical protein GQ600_24330 [Phytophthora cactorum]|nr:hypothetical protein GQ600_24330 [Phytophthora cactorum]
MFYGYFFNRLQREQRFRGFTIITAYFSKYSDLEAFAAFKDGIQIPNPRGLLISARLARTVRGGVIYLYDGPLKVLPP